MKAKKILSTVLAFILIAVMSAGTVSAAVFEDKADGLKSLGLFIGTDKGYELDRAPTRAEAAVMLVRLLGKEAEAKEENYEHPFTDVPEWADAYVGYLYENELTKGMGGDKFGTAEICTLQMFSTFVLRSLGYTEEAEDFVYDEAVDYAAETGIINEELLTYSDTLFNRDCCVAIMCNALETNLKGTETPLLQKLVAEGAVDAAVAAAYAEKALAGDGEEDQVAKLSEVLSGAIGNAANCSIEYTMTIDGESMSAVIYIKDGYVYMDIEGMKIKVSIPVAGGETPSANFDPSSLLSSMGLKEDAVVKSVTVTPAADGVLCNIVISNEETGDIEISMKITIGDGIVFPADLDKYKDMSELMGIL